MCVTVIIQKTAPVRSEANAEFVDVSRGDKDNVNFEWYVAYNKRYGRTSGRCCGKQGYNCNRYSIQQY